jgi:hypothetical protein
VRIVCGAAKRRAPVRRSVIRKAGKVEPVANHAHVQHPSFAFITTALKTERANKDTSMRNLNPSFPSTPTPSMLSTAIRRQCGLETFCACQVISAATEMAARNSILSGRLHWLSKIFARRSKQAAAVFLTFWTSQPFTLIPRSSLERSWQLRTEFILRHPILHGLQLA